MGTRARRSRLAALRGGWDRASLGEAGERPLPREKSTPSAGPTLDSGFLALRVTRQGLQPGRGHSRVGAWRATLPPAPARVNPSGTAPRPRLLGFPSSPAAGTLGAQKDARSTTRPGLGPGGPGACYSLGFGAQARRRRWGWGWRPLLAREAGVNRWAKVGGRVERSGTKERGRRNHQGFSKGQAGPMVPWSSARAPVKPPRSAAAGPTREAARLRPLGFSTSRPARPSAAGPIRRVLRGWERSRGR